MLENIEERRRHTAAKLSPEQQTALGQYFTPASVAAYMAGLIGPCPAQVSLLDAGSGVGILFAAAVEALCQRSDHPEAIHIVAYELDSALAEISCQTLADCIKYARYYGIK